MREVRFHIHRKSAFAGALLPYRMYINGQYIGTIRNGKSLDANVPKAGVYYIEDDILSLRNAVIYDNGLSEYSMKGYSPLAWSFGCPPWTICRRSLLQNIFLKS